MSNPGRRLAGALVVAAVVVGAVVLVSRGAPKEVPVERMTGALDHDETPKTALEVDAALAERQSAGEALGRTAPSIEEPQDPEDGPAGNDGVSLVVRLVSSSGIPVRGRGTKIGLEREGYTRPRYVRGEAATFTFQHVAPGAWTLRASGPVHEEATREVLVPEDAESVEVDLVLAARPAVRIVVVTPQGDPFVPRLPPRARAPRAIPTRERPERFASEVLTEEARHVCGVLHTRDYAGLDERCIGLLELRCEPPLWVHLALGVDVLESRRLEPGVEELVFTLDPEVVQTYCPVVTLKVVDAVTGEPLGAFLGMHFGYWDSSYASEESHGLELGSFRVEGLPGPARLELKATGYEEVRQEIVLPRVPEYDLGTVEMKPVELGELVFDLDLPAGVEKASLEWVPLESVADGVPRSSNAREVGAGESSVEIGAGRWVVWCEARTDEERYASLRHAVQVAPGTQRLSLELVPVREVVLRALEKRSIRVFQVDPDVCLDGPWPCGPKPRTLELVPGSYRVAVTGDHGTQASVPFVVTEDGATVDLP